MNALGDAEDAVESEIPRMVSDEGSIEPTEASQELLSTGCRTATFPTVAVTFKLAKTRNVSLPRSVMVSLTSTMGSKLSRL